VKGIGGLLERKVARHDHPETTEASGILRTIPAERTSPAAFGIREASNATIHDPGQVVSATRRHPDSILHHA
jgi:hypothetical protein